MKKHTLIVGAGPCGVALAIELQRRNVPYTLIDSKTKVAPYSKALALFPRTLEVLDAMGVIDAFLAQGKRIEGVRFYHDGECKGEIPFSHLKTPYPFALFIPQNLIEQLLRQKLAELGGTITDDTKLIAYEDKRAVVEQEGKLHYWDTQYIMGCDGARSKVLEEMNIECQHRKIAQPFTLFDVEFDQDVDHSKLYMFFHQDAMYPLFPFPTARHFRIISTTSSHEHLEHPSDYYSILPPGTKISRILWTSTFQLHPRLVHEMQKDNAFLLGDAAHSISPLGGQGLNTSLQDAFNLGWKFAEVYHKRAPCSLLKTYHQERHPIARGIFTQTTAMTKLISSKYPIIKRMLFSVMTHLMRYKGIKTFITNNMAELAVHYPTTHTRAPNLDLPDGSTLFSHLRAGKYILLMLNSASEVPEELKESCTAISIEGEAAKALASKLSTSCPGQCLIRPDGYVVRKANEWLKQHVSSG